MEVPESFKCTICLDVFEAPVFLRDCKHCFCRICVETLQLDKDARCPLCRVPIESLFTDEQLETVLSSFIVVCSCGESVKLVNARSHAQSCSYVEEANARVVEATKRPGDRNYANRYTFACPFCKEKDLDNKSLIIHCNELHASQSDRSAICPICAVMPWGYQTYVLPDFLRHLNRRHQFSYHEFADFTEDEELALRRVVETSRHIY
ncbi:putative E3 ubiquitin-protein ligase RNF8 [Cardiosporidium cionae]|uniref:E3 ubiquitin-protein ligase RNF8 n=1 Tax=Cardiosporidium cionae TaxID=476202 RepID=A0ABQ7JFK8_9APIC|nr:putative E3 ubiquitin-protein ligase RNF8 [Cardiosporidium cionae]|eukprot:KAF8822802.1 putative E3 ubiquitin-protein ligase RNF8 [Cardiosporidium cionae]